MPESGDSDGTALRAVIAPRLMRAMEIARELLPGDSRYGDPLSTTGSDARAVVARRLGEASAERPGILKQAGLSALQVWEAVTDGADEKPGDQRLAIVFTDLVGFSDWAVEAGDDISRAPAARRGDRAALAAIFEARERLEDVEVAGYRPRMRAGMHVGTPRRLAGDALDGDRLRPAGPAFQGQGGSERVTAYSVKPG